MSIEFDETNWPIAVCRASGDATDEDLRTYTRVLSEYLKRKQRHVLLVDARSGRSLNSRHRKIVSDWNSQHAPELLRYRVALILVSPSTLIRGLLTAIYWMFPAPFNYKAVENMGQAMFWANRELHGAASSVRKSRDPLNSATS